MCSTGHIFSHFLIEIMVQQKFQSNIVNIFLQCIILQIANDSQKLKIVKI